MSEYILVPIALVISFYCFGSLFSHLLRLRNTGQSVYYLSRNILLAIVVLTMSYALISTSLKSIYLLILILFLISYYYSSREKVKFKFEQFSKFIFCLIIFSIFFILFRFVLTDYINQEFIITHPDEHFLSNVSYYLSITGQENEFNVYNLISSDYHGLSPYHFFELWLNAFISKYLNLNFFKFLYLSIPFIVYFLVFVNFLSIYQELKGKLDVFGWLLSFFMLFFFRTIYPIDLAELIGVNDYIEIRNIPLLTNLKTAMYTLSFQYVAILWIRKNYLLSYLSLIIVSFIQFSIIPPVFGFLILWCVYYTLMNRNINTRITLIVLVSFSALYVLMSHFLGNQILGREGTSLGALVVEVLNVTDNLNLRTNAVLKALIETFTRYWLFWIGLFIAVVMKVRLFVYATFFKMILGICLSGLICYFFLFEIQNSEQLFELLINSWMPLLIFILSVIYLNSLNLSTQRIRYISLGLISFMIFRIGLNLYNKEDSVVVGERYSYDYLSNVKEFITRPDVRIVGASFNDPSFYSNSYVCYPTIYTNGIYLSQMRNGATTISLSEFEIPDFGTEFINERAFSGKSLGYFFRSVNTQKLKGEFHSIERSQQELIKGFDYAIFSKDYKIPLSFNELIERVMVDDISGERFVIFKRIN